MINSKKLLFLIISFLFFLSQISYANFFTWNYIESDHFIVFYPQGYEKTAQKIITYAELQRPFVSKNTANPNIKARIVLQNNGSQYFGYIFNADPMIGISTMSRDSFSPITNNNFYLIGLTHELTHEGQFYNSSVLGSILPFIFTNEMNIQVNIPMWLIEGVTTYTESKITPYDAMLNMPETEAIIQSKAKADQLPNVQAASFMTYNEPDFPYLRGVYYYGGSFLNFLANQYGAEKIPQFIQNLGSKIHVPSFVDFLNKYVEVPIYSFFLDYAILYDYQLGMEVAAQEVFKKDFSILFEEWIQYEKNKSQTFKIDGEQQTHSEGIKSFIVSDQQNIYYYKKYVESVSPFLQRDKFVIMSRSITANNETVLLNMPADVAAPMQIKNNNLYYAILDLVQGYENYNNNGCGFLKTVYQYDLKTHQNKELFSDNFRAFSVTGNIIYYAKDKKDSEFSEIWVYQNNSKQKIAEINECVSELFVYQNELIIVSKKPEQSWNINKLNLASGEITLLVATNWVESNIKFQEEKDQFIFTSYFDKKGQLYQYSLLTNEITQLTQGGYASEGIIEGSDLYFLSLNEKGHQIYKKLYQPQALTKPFELENNKVPSVSISFDELKTKKGPALVKNFNYFLRPYKKDFYLSSDYSQSNIYLLGADGLRENFYSIDHNLSTGFTSFEFESSFFAPNRFDLYLNSEKEYTVSYTIPIYKTNRFGLYEIDLEPSYTDSLRKDADIENQGLSGSIITYFKFPETKHNIQLSYLPQNNSYSFFNGNIYYWLTGSIDLKFWGSLEKDSVITYKSLKSNLFINQKIGQIRAGAWIPYIYIRDIYFFSDNTYNFLKEDYTYSAGINIETSIGTHQLLTSIGLNQKDVINISFQYQKSFFTGL